MEEVDQAIDELRDFVQGVYPVLLTSRGLSTALAAASRREARPIAVFANGIELVSPRSRRPSTSAVLPLGQCRQACRALGDDRPRLGSRRAVLLDREHGPRLDPQRMTAGGRDREYARPYRRRRRDLTIDSTWQGGIKGSVPHAG